MAQQAPMGQGLIIIGHSWSHSDTPHLVGLLWTSDQARRRDLWQNTTITRDIHAPGGIRTHNSSKWAAADPCLRPRGHWDRLTVNLLSSYSSQNLDPPVYKLLWYPSHQFPYKEDDPELLECYTSLKKPSNTGLFQLINVIIIFGCIIW
jgi:hypothetical protein